MPDEAGVPGVRKANTVSGIMRHLNELSAQHGDAVVVVIEAEKPTTLTLKATADFARNYPMLEKLFGDLFNSVTNGSVSVSALF